MRILVVDDVPALRRAMRRVLREHDITEAGSVEDARRELMRGDFDAVVSDVTMPGESGADLHRWVTDRHPHLTERFVFVTGGIQDEETRAYIYRTGAPILGKPFPLRLFLDLLRGWEEGLQA